jgi:excinuclease ABC subunit C
MFKDKIINLSLPNNPGVYLFKNKEDKIIYVGKAKNLKKRVSSYFNASNKSTKTQFLLKNIQDIEFIVVDNEVEALLLENKLIKKHNPKYNILLKDSKTYSYIILTNEKFPRIYSTKRKAISGKYFGPYTDGSSRREIVELCNKLFKLRTCKNLPKRACLQYHIGLCSAPCINQVTSEEYSNQVNQARTFLQGDTKPTLNKLKQDMKKASKNQLYEIAFDKKRQIQAITILEEKQKVDLIKKIDQDVIGCVENDFETIISLFSIKKGVITGKKEFKFNKLEEIKQEDTLLNFIKMYYSQEYIPQEIIVSQEVWENKNEKSILEQYLEKIKGFKVKLTFPKKGNSKKLVELANKNAYYKLENKVLKDIQQKLNLSTLPRVIECFDISNLGYDYLVGGMVQFVNAIPNKSEYRKFEIKETKLKNDDFASMREVIFRRYKRQLDENRPMPDLIIVDGGLGQLNVSLDVLKQLGLHIPLIGLAKREEEIYIPYENNPLTFNKNSSMMLLLRQIRDSTHNFVISYNRKKRTMKFKTQTNQINQK